MLKSQALKLKPGDKVLDTRNRTTLTVVSVVKQPENDPEYPMVKTAETEELITYRTLI